MAAKKAESITKAKAKAPVAAKKQAPPPEPDDDEDESFDPDDDEPGPARRNTAPVRPPQGGRDRDEGPSQSGGFHRPRGSLFEGARDSFILYQGSFDVQELHELIELADADSIEPGTIRIKILTVDEKFQNGGPNRVNLVFAGKQKPRPMGQRGGQGNGRAPVGRGNNRRW